MMEFRIVNVDMYTQEEIEKLVLIRAIEWSKWPCFLTCGVGQLFLLSTNFLKILLVFIILEFFWFFIAEKIVSFYLAQKYYWIHWLAWITSPFVATIMFIRGNILLSIVALLWFFIIMTVSFILKLVISIIFKPLGIWAPRIGIIELKMGASIFGIGSDAVKRHVIEANELRKTYS